MKVIVIIFIFSIMFNLYQYGQVKELKKKQETLLKDEIGNYHSVLLRVKDTIKDEQINPTDLQMINVLLTETGDRLSYLLTNFYGFNGYRVSEFNQYLLTKIEKVQKDRTITPDTRSSILNEQIILINIATEIFGKYEPNKKITKSSFNDFEGLLKNRNIIK